MPSDYKGPRVTKPTSLPPPLLTQRTARGQDEIDFILIRQKDKIYNFINARRFSEASACLRVVKELWYSLEYEYKHTQLVNLIKEARNGTS